MSALRPRLQRFDLNDYSIPHDRVGQPVVITASLARVWISTATADRLAEHGRSWSRGEQIEDEAHLAALAREKRQARELGGRDRLRNRCPAADDFCAALAARNVTIGWHTRRLKSRTIPSPGPVRSRPRGSAAPCWSPTPASGSPSIRFRAGRKTRS